MTIGILPVHMGSGFRGGLGSFNNTKPSSRTYYELPKTPCTVSARTKETFYAVASNAIQVNNLEPVGQRVKGDRSSCRLVERSNNKKSTFCHQPHPPSGFDCVWRSWWTRRQEVYCSECRPPDGVPKENNLRQTKRATSTAPALLVLLEHRRVRCAIQLALLCVTLVVVVLWVHYASKQPAQHYNSYSSGGGLTTTRLVDRVIEFDTHDPIQLWIVRINQ